MIRAGWRGFIAFLAMLAVLVVVGGSGADAAVGGAFAAGRATLDTTSAEAADAADHPGIVNVSTGWRPDTAADGYAPDVGGHATLAQRLFVAAEAGSGGARFVAGSDGVVTDLAFESRAPGVSVQQQAGHIAGTPQYANRIKFGKPTSVWRDDLDADQLTRLAWLRGTPVPNSPALRLFDFGVPIGRGAYGGLQTQVRVSMRGDGLIHGSL